jgi:hypothetical protein
MARLYILLLVMFFASGCKNLFETTADTESTEAILFQIKEHLNDFEWDAAIDLYNDLATDVQNEREPKRLYVSALMGRCGFEFVSFVNTVSEDLENNTTRLFPLLLQAMPDSTTSGATDCNDAYVEINEMIAASGGITDDYNLAVLNGLARLGSITNSLAANASNQYDSSVDPCDPADFPNADVRQMVSAFAVTISNIESSSLSFLGDSLDTICDVGEPLQVSGVCGATDPAAVTPTQICAMRALMNESVDLGFGTCTGDIVACACAVCP